MAISLLFALLDVADAAGLAAAAASDPTSRAGRYSALTPKQKTRVQEALYEAFYPILEARYINTSAYAASSAIGGALGRIISREQPTTTFMQSSEVAELRNALTTLVDRAITNEEP